MKQLYMTAFALTILVLTGCVKVQIPKTNSIAGSIVDEKNMTPIQGATIFYSDYPEQKIITQSDGRFELLTTFEERWRLPFPTDHHPAELNVTVIGGNGYNTKTIVGNSRHPMIIKLTRGSGEESVFTLKNTE